MNIRVVGLLEPRIVMLEIRCAVTSHTARDVDDVSHMRRIDSGRGDQDVCLMPPGFAEQEQVGRISMNDLRVRQPYQPSIKLREIDGLRSRHDGGSGGKA